MLSTDYNANAQGTNECIKFKHECPPHVLNATTVSANGSHRDHSRSHRQASGCRRCVIAPPCVTLNMSTLENTINKSESFQILIQGSCLAYFCSISCIN